MIKAVLGGAALCCLVGAAPALAIDVQVGPDGIRISPRDRDYEKGRYSRDRREQFNRDRDRDRDRDDCRKVTIERPDGSRVVKYRCD